jgi:hypothetical protein
MTSTNVISVRRSTQPRVVVQRDTEGSVLSVQRKANRKTIAVQQKRGPVGATGTDGALWLVGTTAPTIGIGSPRDFYVNTDTWEVYRKDDTNVWVLMVDLDANATLVLDAQAAAEAARDAALIAETNAETAEVNAELAETNAETAATAAAASQSAAATSATNAATSATNAATSATAAATSATAAATSATAAQTAETNAETAETNAELAETNAETAATAAAASQSAAATSATAAAGSASAAATSATNAANSATAADASADAAAASELAADASADAAAASAAAAAVFVPANYVEVAGDVMTGALVTQDRLAIRGDGVEGGQIVLGYHDNTDLIGEEAKTWNIDVDSTDTLRIYTLNAAGASAFGTHYFSPDGHFVVQRDFWALGGYIAAESSSGWAGLKAYGYGGAFLELKDTEAGANLKFFQQVFDNGALTLKLLNDDASVKSTPLTLNADGTATFGATPTFPTATAGDVSTKGATTAFADAVARKHAKKMAIIFG